MVQGRVFLVCFGTTAMRNVAFNPLYPVNRAKCILPPDLDGGRSIHSRSIQMVGRSTLTLSGNMWNSAVPSSLANDGHGFAQQYGYFEMSAQLPANPGTWPSFWMRPVNPASNVGEIDIMEAYTQFQNSYCATLHDWANTANSVGNCPNSVVEVGNPPNPALSTGYHVYAMRWTPTMVSFYLMVNLFGNIHHCIQL